MSFNYAPMIKNNLNVLRTILLEDDDALPSHKYKINAYDKAIAKLPEIVTFTVGRQRIAGDSIMAKINKIIRTNDNLPEVTEYLQEKYELENEEDTESSVTSPISSEHNSETYIHYLKVLNYVEACLYDLDTNDEQVQSIFKNTQILRTRYVTKLF